MEIREIIEKNYNIHSIIVTEKTEHGSGNTYFKGMI